MRSVLPVTCLVLLMPLAACETTKSPSSEGTCEYARLLQGLQQASGRPGQATSDKDGNPAVAFGSISHDNMQRYGIVTGASAEGGARPSSYENVLLSKKPSDGVCGATVAYQVVYPRNQ